MKKKRFKIELIVDVNVEDSISDNNVAYRFADADYSSLIDPLSSSLDEFGEVTSVNVLEVYA